MLPEFSFGPFVSLPTYFFYLSFLVSFLFFLTLKWSAHLGLNQKIALNLALLLSVSGFIGGRLFHVLYEGFDYYARYPQAIFMFWMGGYVFFGGAILAGVAGFIYLRVIREPFWEWFDALAPLMALGYGLGRFACFLAGCCYGKYCDWPWSINGRHPTQLYAVFFEVSVAGFLTLQVRRQRGEHWPLGAIALTWLLLHAVGRLMMEFYRDDFRGSLIMGLSISTWLSLLLFSAAAGGLSFVWWQQRSKNRS